MQQEQKVKVQISRHDTSQYDMRSSARSSTNSGIHRTDASMSSNQSSNASRPEFQKFKEANGYEPPARRKKSGSMVGIHLDDESHVVTERMSDRSRRSIFDPQQSDANSSVMSSSTNSTMSSGNMSKQNYSVWSSPSQYK